MRRIAIVLFAIALLCAGFSMQARSGWSGTYSVNGTNPGVGAYTGTPHHRAARRCLRRELVDRQRALHRRRNRRERHAVRRLQRRRPLLVRRGLLPPARRRHPRRPLGRAGRREGSGDGNRDAQVVVASAIDRGSQRRYKRGCMPSFPLFRERPQKHEWIGGRYTFPLEIPDGKDVRQPEVILWMEMPDRMLVGSKAIDPRERRRRSRSRSTRRCCIPIEGPPRRPLRIRVPDERMAGELRRAFRGIPVIVAPVPELDELFEELCEAGATGGESQLPRRRRDAGDRRRILRRGEHCFSRGALASHRRATDHRRRYPAASTSGTHASRLSALALRFLDFCSSGR